jgi:hypothetical protein
MVTSGANVEGDSSVTDSSGVANIAMPVERGACGSSTVRAAFESSTAARPVVTASTCSSARAAAIARWQFFK